PDPVDQTAVEVGREELPALPVEHDIADTGPAIAGKRGEERDFAGPAVHAPDRAGSAFRIFAKLAGHPFRIGMTVPDALGIAVAIRIGKDDVQAISRGCAEIDIRRAAFRAIIERGGEHLSDLAGLDL